MDFALNDEQREFKDLCRRFAAEVIRPAAPRHDADESTPWEVMREAREWGLHGVENVQRRVPECFGDGDEIKMGAYAVTEPQAGSDVRSLRSTAKLDGDEWVLNGTKVFISNGGIADVHVVVATVDPELGHRGQASFVIAKGTPGLKQGKKESKLGIRASHTAEVILEDCRVPVENLLGGMEKLERKLERARSGESTGRASNALATFELTRPVVQTKDSPLEKFFRDAKIYQLFEGTAEIQRMVISRMQAAEYRERFKQGVEVAQEAIASTASGNGAHPSRDGKAVVAG